MAEEIGALRAVLALESAAFDRGVASARRSLTGLEGGFNRTTGQVVQFGRQMSGATSAGFQAVARSSGAAKAGLQNFGFQVQDFAVQVAGGTSATRALAQQLPQLLSGFGLFGVLAGTATAVLVPLIGYLFQADQATKSWVDTLSLTGGSIGGVEGAVSSLKGVQEQYNTAIAASGGASSAAASLVIANSAKEFEARKALLGVELQLLRLRGQEQASDSGILSDQIRLRAEMANPLSTLSDPATVVPDSSGRKLGDYVNLGPRNAAEMGLGDEFHKNNQRDQLAVQKLNAELTLTNLTIADTENLMNSTFSTIAGAGGGAVAGSGGGGKGGSGGGGHGGAPRAAAQIANITAQTQQLNQTAQMLKGTLGNAFVDLVTGAKSFSGALSEVADQLAKMLAQSAFDGLFAKLGGGKGGGFLAKLMPCADGNVFGGGRVQAYANGGIVTSPTLFPMASGAGLMGEAGPEAVMPLTRIGGKLGVRAEGSGGGGATINIDARYATEGTAEMIVRALQRAAPQIVKQAVLTSRGASARGY